MTNAKNSDTAVFALMRHTQAAKRSDREFPDDSIRPLTDSGIKKATHIARAFKSFHFFPQGIWASPYLRTRQTAETVAQVLGLRSRQVRYLDCLVEAASAEKSFHELHRIFEGQPILLIGHQPFLGEWLSISIFGKSHSRAFSLRKGAVALLTGKPLTPGNGELMELLAPSTLMR